MSEAEMTTTSYRQVSGALLFVGSVQFFLGLLLAEEVYPSYAVWQTISDLGVAGASVASARIFNSSLFLQGVLAVAAAFFLYLSYRRILVSTFFVLGGLGAIGGALFPEDVHPIHLEISIMSFFVAGLTPFATLRLQKPPFTYISILLGALSFVAAFLLSQNYLFGLPYGAMERMIAYPTLLWVIGFGGYLMSNQSQTLN